MADSEQNEWRETVRDLYDQLHFEFEPDNVFSGNPLAKRIVAFIEDRHPGFFLPPRDAIVIPKTTTDIVTKLRDDLFLDSAEAQHAAADEIERLRSDVIAFCGPYAANYARDCGFPDGHLHPTHYDILKQCGARMDDFTRATIGEPDAE